uniref:Uncharacterized protein n=1 Tax=Klebsiella pneumoniae TaxID=573 RepID=A0A482E5W3_KLEPN|nr:MULTISPECIES: hypothetical protein [Enterobacteriaceae]QBM19299.1 hypothetical protein [Klebsiella pneumoniae]
MRTVRQYPGPIQLATVALTLKAEWPTLKTMSKDRLLRQLKYEVLRIDNE